MPRLPWRTAGEICIQSLKKLTARINSQTCRAFQQRPSHFREALFGCRVIELSFAEVCVMDSAPTATTTRKADGTPASRETLTVTDNRTGRSYEVPITHGTIRASDLRQIKVDPKEFGMMSYDPAFNNTASCISRITYIDGDVGILR